MRSRRYKDGEGADSSYDLSISDLMAALCCIFILFTVGLALPLVSKNKDANQYNETKKIISDVIEDALGDYAKPGEKQIVDFEKERLILRFKESEFKENEALLGKKFENNIDIIFPILMKALYDSGKKDEVEEIRIEGFTATDSNDGKRLDIDDKDNPYISYFINDVGEGSDHDYITGYTLSQKRTMNVLSKCLTTNYLDGVKSSERNNFKNWVRTHMSASGYSFIRPLNENGKEYEFTSKPKMDKATQNRSRRVEIRIKTKADKVVEQLQTNIEDLLDENK